MAFAVSVDDVMKSVTNPVSKHQIQPEYVWRTTRLTHTYEAAELARPNFLAPYNKGPGAF